MHVDWDWIKQRPHYFAEVLSKNNAVFVLYIRSNRRSNLSKNSKERIRAYPVINIPKQFKFKIIKNLNFLIHKFIYSIAIYFWKPDVVWLSYPTMVKELPKHAVIPIIYDCMDNHYSMAPVVNKLEILNCEKDLVAKATAIIVSSDQLLLNIQEIAEPECKKIHIVRNGYNGVSIVPEANNKSNQIFKICYVGTVGKWFDWNIINHGLLYFPELEFHIIGPIEYGIDVLKHERITYYGVVEHEKLYSRVKAFDCFIMPFIVNDIILSVDPVKLYEYINFDKNIICVKYREIERFQKFVHYYNDENEFINTILCLMKDNTLKYSAKDRIQFLLNNTWKSRAVQLDKIIDNIES